MNISAETYGHAVILSPHGELTADSLDAFRQAVQQQMKSTDILDLVLNFANVPFIDSAALEYLLDLQEALGKKLGQIKLVKCDENIRKILEITRLEGDFELFDDIPDFVKAIQP